MSDLVERLRDWGHPDWFYVDTNLLEENQSVRLEAADRIEVLEKHKRLQTEDVMNLGAALGQAQVRIEALEAALRWINAKTDDRLAAEFARAALAPEQDK